MEFVMLVSANDTTMTAHKLSDIRSIFPRWNSIYLGLHCWLYLFLWF